MRWIHSTLLLQVKIWLSPSCEPFRALSHSHLLVTLDALQVCLPYSSFSCQDKLTLKGWKFVSGSFLMFGRTPPFLKLTCFASLRASLFPNHVDLNGRMSTYTDTNKCVDHKWILIRITESLHFCAAAVIGSVLGFIILLLLVVLIWRCCRRKQSASRCKSFARSLYDIVAISTKATMVLAINVTNLLFFESRGTFLRSEIYSFKSIVHLSCSWRFLHFCQLMHNAVELVEIWVNNHWAMLER